jgi:hypothetical protein
MVSRSDILKIKSCTGTGIYDVVYNLNRLINTDKDT